MKTLLTTALLSLAATTASAQQPTAWNTPGNLNPILPGYFADPTIRRFGDTYYIYATTDGTGNGYGPAQAWASRDLRHWRNYILNWPTTQVVWAPDVVQQNDTTFRYYYCEPCNILVGEGPTPLGPWRNILGKSDAVMVPDRYVHNAITLDPQLFRDDDGQEYLYFTTWGIYKDFGCGVARLNKDYRPGPSDADARRWREDNPFPIAADQFFSEKRLIPNTELKDIFEAPYVFKRQGIYYFTYSSGSCHDDTYRVQYATSTAGPMGPFQYKGCILQTNADGTIHGPGHHSMLEGPDGQWYIVYHRHNNPHAVHGFNRQVCIDRVEFDSLGNILPVEPTHGGVDLGQLTARQTARRTFWQRLFGGKKQKQQPEAVNLAYRCRVRASSEYSADFRADYAVDDNNGTLWRAARCLSESDSAWIELDLGSQTAFNQVWLMFEYPTFFYQYLVKTSADGQRWQLYADKTQNTQAGSPLIEEGEAKARYIRIYITDTQKNGHMPALWNVQVYQSTPKCDPRSLLPATEDIDLKAVERGYPWLHKKDVSPDYRMRSKMKGHKIVDINADDYMGEGKPATTASLKNRTGGTFSGKQPLRTEVKRGKTAFYFNGQQTLQSSFQLPQTFTYNGPYTIVAWTLNPTVSPVETVLSLSPSRADLATTEFRLGSDPQAGLVQHNGLFESCGASQAILKGADRWQHWVITFDGYMERVYLDGQLLHEQNNFIMLRPDGPITLGASGDGTNRFTGYLHSLQLYDRSFTAQEAQAAFREKSDTSLKTVYDKAPQVKTEVRSPQLIGVQLTDQQGEPIETGLLSFRYAVTSQFSKKDTVGLRFSAPTNNATALLGTDGGRQQKVYIHVKDDTGALDQVITQNVSVNPATFQLTRQEEEQQLSFAGGTTFNENPLSGAQVLKEVSGDFVLQTRITGIDGQERHSTPAYNEGGILVSTEGLTIQLGVFPAYNCGNIFTLLTPKGRPQRFNGKGWQFDPYLQLERRGNLIYARTSPDGIHWQEMDSSPVTLPATRQGAFKLALYQTTYTDNSSWVKAGETRVYTRK